MSMPRTRVAAPPRPDPHCSAASLTFRRLPDATTHRSSYTHSVGHLRCCRARLRLRRLRAADAAAHRASRAAGADRRRAGHPRLQSVGRHAVLRAGRGGRWIRSARRVSDRSPRPPACAGLEHPALRRLGAGGWVRDLDRDAARPSVRDLCRGRGRVRRGGRVVGGVVSGAETARGGARLHAGVFVDRRPPGERCLLFHRHLRRYAARDPRWSRALALHADVGGHSGAAPHCHPAVSAGVADVVPERSSPAR